MDKTNTALISKKDDYENFSDIKNILLVINLKSISNLNQNINQIYEKFENLTIDFKVESFNLIKTFFLNMIKKENSEELINSLNSKNRKFFEKMIICENLDEYILLNHVNETKKQNSELNKYAISIEEEYEKNKMINECLLSSHSWKLTRFLRIKDLLRRI
ncbi:MAG: hypothetical protein E7Z85_02510 [Methanosphaera stadtmanae]|nr:hypothetical protein [Methanosphaera stadtmanae]